MSVYIFVPNISAVPLDLSPVTFSGNGNALFILLLGTINASGPSPPETNGGSPTIDLLFSSLSFIVTLGPTNRAVLSALLIYVSLIPPN